MCCSMADDTFALMNMSHCSFHSTPSHQELLRALPIQAVSWYSSSSSLTFCAFSLPRGASCAPTQRKAGPQRTQITKHPHWPRKSRQPPHTVITSLWSVSCTTYRCLKPVCISDPHRSSQLLSSTGFSPAMVKRTTRVCPLSPAWAFAFLDYDQL